MHSEWQVSGGSDTIALDSSFRKCSYTPKSSTNMAECYTPGSLIVKACVKETPKSTRGSSMFSPGEAFWNEAIQLADGLCVPMVNDSSKVIEESNVVEDQLKMERSCNLQNCDGKPRKIFDQSKSRIWNTEMSTPLGLVGLHTKDPMKEVSNLPVKHFDFSFEDSNLDENTQQNCSVDEKKNVVQEKISVDALCKRVKLSSPDNVSMTSNSPLNNVWTAISTHASDEASTPSSGVPLNDHLDLNSWLPPEICSIYRKKGISKLYSWQVQTTDAFYVGILFASLSLSLSAHRHTKIHISIF